MGVIFLFLFIIAIFVFVVTKKSKERYTWSDDSNDLMTLDDKYNASKIATQKELDRLLDKIYKKGYHSLTKKEKELLDEYSRKV